MDQTRTTCAITCLLLVVGCAPSAVRTASVFGDRLPFVVDATDPDVLIYRNPALKVTSYSTFLIDPVVINDVSTTARPDIQPAAKKELAALFREELVQALADAYAIVDKPGPNVLRVRSAIREFQPTTLELDEEKFMVIRFDTIVQNAEMELDCLDALSGERVVSLIRTLNGPRYAARPNHARFQNIQEAFADWARVLRKRFDAARKKSDLLYKLQTDETSPLNTNPTGAADIKREEGE